MVYIGAHYELNVITGVEKTYYSGFAMRQHDLDDGDRSEDTVYYILKDHLNGTNIIADETGTLISETRYTAFGETRYQTGDLITDIGYTGQRQEASLDLYFYNARWYDPALGRFAQADTILPNPGDAKAFDRYAYVNNNPVRFNDPSGHCIFGIDTLVCVGIAVGALIGAGIGYGVQVVDNLDQGMALGDALTTDIQAVPIIVGGIAGGITGGVVGYAASLVAPMAADLAKSIWDLNPLQRGREIEKMLGGEKLLASNNPIIDLWDKASGVATSIKSMDIFAKSYQNLNTLFSKGKSYIDALANWSGNQTWDGVKIQLSDIVSWRLILAIPEGATEAQMAMLNKLIQYASEVDIELIIEVIK